MLKPAKLETKYFVALYAAVAGSFLILLAVVWECIIAGKWYYCADGPNFFCLPDFFFASFAHPKLDASDWYAVDEYLVYALWGFMVFVALCTPRLVLRRYFLKQP